MREYIDQSEELVQVVETICKQIAHKFQFGSYELEDLFQESYVFALTELHKYDESRGSLYNYLYSLLYSRLFNLKRNKWGRFHPPCRQCPLGGILDADGLSCSVFNSTTECEILQDWKALNLSKQNLAGCSDASEADNNYVQESSFEPDEETVALYDKYINNPKDRNIWLRFLHNDKLTKDEVDRLMSVIDGI